MIYSSIDECVKHLRLTHDVVLEVKCDYDNIESAKIDLYLNLSRAYKQEFLPTERLVLILDHDFYNSSSQSGSILQAIQIITQDIDISNFFICVVTTNPEIFSEYQYVKDNVSIDPVSFHIYECHGKFDKIKSEHKPMNGKVESIKHIIDDIGDLSDKHQRMLFSSPVFCMIPWVGINIEPDSSARPCCEYQDIQIGSTSTQSIKEIWNSEKIKNIRKSMLDGIEVKGCQSCYHKEHLKRDSLRNSINRDFSHLVDLVDRTNDDGSVDFSDIRYWDIRYNNLCNFSCRSCGPYASTSWYEVHNSLNPTNKIQIPLLQAGQSQDLIFDQIISNIDSVEKIYFAGGEPTMIKNFYRILEILDDRGRNDVHLCYNINLSRLSLKDRSILDLWKRFPKVSVGASLDAMGARAEYLRTGTDWSVVTQNRRKIMEECPHVYFYISATTSLINALHIPDFHKSWVEQELIGVEDFNIQLLYEPDYSSVVNAPSLLKQKIISLYQQHLKWINSKDMTGRAKYGFQSIIDFCQEPGSYDPEKFWFEIDRLDHYHKTDLLETFPELRDVGLDR